MGEGPLICVDFDKTLTDPDQDEWQPAFQQEPDQSVIDATEEAYKSGKKIVIWTARQWSEAAEVAGWLTAHEVPYHGLRCGKGGAEKYVDDKTVSPQKFVNEYSEDESVKYTDAESLKFRSQEEAKNY